MTTISPLVDKARWPDVAAVPRSRFRAALAAMLVRRVAARLPLRVQYPDGRIVGSTVDTPILRVRDAQAFHRRLGTAGLVGFGEAYQAGDWETDDLPALLAVFADNVERIVPSSLQWLRHFHGARFPAEETNTLDGAKRNIHRHYDLSNELFSLFLDDTMTYSAALFDSPLRGGEVPSFDRLADAQRRKIDRLLDRTGVTAGSRVLEIGTGWGELAIRAAQRGATVHTVTLSAEQRALAIERAEQAGVADRITVELRDYREIAGDHVYDAILSVEMIEAVGERYWPTYFATLDRLLAPGGRIGIQAITMPHDRMRASRKSYTWMHKYVFPGGLIPSLPAIEKILARHTGLRVADRFAFGEHYAETLRLWRERFTANAAQVTRAGFDSTFGRTWKLYLAYCEAGFATGYLNVYQLVMEPAR